MSIRTIGKALVLLAMAVSGISGLSAAQTAEKTAFEVASVKPNTSGSSASRSSIDPAGFLRASNTTLRMLILQAYRIFDYQLIGAPDWISTARFDIDAKADPGVAKPDVPAMTQALLEERFRLKVHHETKELSVFVMTLANNGVKLQTAVEGRPGPGGLGAGSTRTGTGPAGAEITGSGVHIEKLIEFLIPMVGRPVINKTNLTGTYDFSLKFIPPQAPNTGVITGGFNPGGAELSGPSVFTALEEQLGLKLESARAPVDVLVMDSVSKPTEN